MLLLVEIIQVCSRFTFYACPTSNWIPKPCLFLIINIWIILFTIRIQLYLQAIIIPEIYIRVFQLLTINTIWSTHRSVKNIDINCLIKGVIYLFTNNIIIYPPVSSIKNWISKRLVSCYEPRCGISKYLQQWPSLWNKMIIF